MDDVLEIAGKQFRSRLLLGSGKFRTADEMRDAYAASETEIVTVAIRRLDLDDPSKKTLLDEIDWTKYTVLPNTAGCYNVEDAVRVARLGRELTQSNWVKLEVIGDPKYLWPDPIGTLEAARILVKEGFVVLPYTHRRSDPRQAARRRRLRHRHADGLADRLGPGHPVLRADQGHHRAGQRAGRRGCRARRAVGCRRSRWSLARTPAW